MKFAGGFFIFLGYMLFLSMSWSLVDIFVVNDVSSGSMNITIQLVGGVATIVLGAWMRGWEKRYDTISQGCIGFSLIGLVLALFFIIDSQAYSPDFWKGVFYLIITAVMFSVALIVPD